jgi:hypothetical protein
MKIQQRFVADSVDYAGTAIWLERLGSFPNDQNDVDRALATIERAITNSFLIGFIPELRDGKPHDGKPHKLTVELPKAERIDFRYTSVFNFPPEP